MLCTIYKSSKKSDTYLYLAKKDDFSSVPKELLSTFGKPILVMPLLLKEGRELAQADIEKVKQALNDQGYYLQLPPPAEDLLKQHKQQLSQQK
jgi:uncharacterized protein YcgL (UPF0745 family)